MRTLLFRTLSFMLPLIPMYRHVTFYTVKLQSASLSFIYSFMYIFITFCSYKGENNCLYNDNEYFTVQRKTLMVRQRVVLLSPLTSSSPTPLFSARWPRPSCNVPVCVWRTSRPAGLSQTQSHSTLITLRAVSALCFNNTPCQLTPHCAKLSRWNSL